MTLQAAHVSDVRRASSRFFSSESKDVSLTSGFQCDLGADGVRPAVFS